MSADPELEAFKSQVDLREYAADQGYTLDRRESWSGSAVMRSGGDKIVIKRDSDGHYVYFSVRDESDNGSIIDFIQNRKRLNLGEVRKELRPWAPGGTASMAARSGRPLPRFLPLQKTGKDHMQVETLYSRMREASRHPYLEQERALPAALLSSPRFAGRVRCDAHGNAVFPHFDEQGLCGYELKNRGFTGFAKGGEKGLWFSHAKKSDSSLLFAESAIDALSHAALFPDDQTRYASIGGKPSPRQPGLIRAAIAKMPAASEIAAAMDNDADGQKLCEIVRQAFIETGRSDLRFLIDCPEGAKDWNDVLRNSAPSFPAARELNRL